MSEVDGTELRDPFTRNRVKRLHERAVNVEICELGDDDRGDLAPVAE